MNRKIALPTGQEMCKLYKQTSSYEKDMFHNIKIPYSICHEFCCYGNTKCYRVRIKVITIKQSEKENKEKYKVYI
jgi:hypothetical protein